MKTAILLTIILLSLSLPLYTSAASSETMSAVRVTTPPVLDGIVNPEEYPVEPASGFKQYRPNLRDPAINDTEIYIVYDDEALYIGWVCYERDTSGLVASQKVRDSFLNPDDSVDILLDANNDGQSAYDFMVNSCGTLYDGYIAQDGQAGGRDWDGVWDAEVSVAEDRWFVEMRIPWETLTYSTDATSMGIQFLRNEKPDHEDTYWASDGVNLNRVSTFGTVTGFEGLKPPKRFAITPYAAVHGVTPPEDEPDNMEVMEITPDGGLDFAYKGGKGFQLNTTVNPDYAQIEADPEYINLDPGNIYLDEKRQFFTEALTTFSADQNIFYTRNMTEILGGVKATGTIGPITYGLLNVQLGNSDPLYPSDNVTAARIKGTVYESSYVGGMLVARKEIRNLFLDDPTGPDWEPERTQDYNAVGLVDANLAITNSWSVVATGIKAFNRYDEGITNPAAEGEDYGYSFKVINPNPTGYLAVAYNEFHPFMEADLGFIAPNELNKREVWTYGSKQFVFDDSFVRIISGEHYYTHWWNLEDNQSINNFWQPNLNVTFDNDITVFTFGGYGYDGRFVSYGYPIEKTNYTGFGIGTTTISWGRITGRYWRGTVFGANYNSYQLDATVTPLASLHLGFDLEVIDPYFTEDERNAPGSDANTDKAYAVANFNIVHNILENLYWRAIVQGDTDSDVYLGSALVAWTYQPGSTAYLAYEEERLDSSASGDFELIDRQVFLKVSYMLNL